MGGLVGNEILHRFNVIMNYEKRDIYLTPNSHFNEPFDYSYPGIELYYINGLIIVGDVSANSSAEKAGIKEGDIVLAVDKNVSQNLNQYKLALQNTGKMIQIIVKRGNELKEFKFKIGSIY